MSTTLNFGPVQVVWPWAYQLVAQPSNIPSNGPWNYTTTALTNGTAAGQADVLYTAQTTIAGNANTTLNLSSLTNAFGSTVSLARIKAMYFENTATPSGGTTRSSSIAIGGAGVTPFVGGFFNAGTDTLTLRNGVHMSVGVVQDATGYVVGTGVNLEIANSDASNSAIVNIGLAGCSA